MDATSEDRISQGSVSMTILCVCFCLLISFVVTGSMLVRRLWTYFGDNYKNHRPSLIAKLILALASLACLNARYLIEFLYCKQVLSFNDSGDENTISIYGALVLILFSDIGPFIIQLACLWIGSKNNHEYLAIEKLNKEIPIARDLDKTTDAGSNMLEELRKEFEDEGIESYHLASDLFPTELGSYIGPDSISSEGD